MNRSTILLIALLIILAVITYFLLPSEKEREASYKLPTISLKVDSASVIKIEIKQPSSSIVMENVGGTWMITSPHPSSADPAAVANFLNSLSKFKVGSLISSNPDKQRLFQVDSAGTLLHITDRSGKIVSMIVGKMGPSFSEIYFRLPDSKDVYLGEGIDSWTINKNVKDWRDKSIVHIPAESMKEITITAGSKMYRFNNDSSGWRLGDKSVETSEMNPLLNTLSNLRADDFVDTVAEIKSKPITIDLKSMENISLSLYPTLPDSTHYFVKSSRSQQTYVVNKWTVQQLFKPIGKPLPVSAPVQQVAETPKKEPVISPKKEPEVQPITVTTPTKKPITKEPVSETKKLEEGKKQIPTSSQPAKPSQAETKKPVAKPKQTTPAIKTTPPSAEPTKTKAEPTKQAIEDEGELTVHTVAKGETMTTIAKKYNVTTEQILKWNLLKTIAVKPGQELYIYVRK